MIDLREFEHRFKSVRSARQSSALEGMWSTDATRADQILYTFGSITAAQLVDRVRRRHNVK